MSVLAYGYFSLDAFLATVNVLAFFKGVLAYLGVLAYSSFLKMMLKNAKKC